jgi:hypothetical protein
MKRLACVFISFRLLGTSDGGEGGLQLKPLPGFKVVQKALMGGCNTHSKNDLRSSRNTRQGTHVKTILDILSGIVKA